ncbi:coiled-coil domain-containing protein 127-like [Centropristis striata]|uniref:coiled-coil domain-containing protein 127-like n=1 Tax=Centropristis striata TaxID=184440 RepID=UPI0027E20CAC|nr:coiled-coil domain-containing protein 127-like [Centropristis striata]
MYYNLGATSMNNLNDPQPDPRGRGAGAADGNQWNYALQSMVPMLGLAAFRWIWDRYSQREIQKIKTQHEETLTEMRMAVAALELELEKERDVTKEVKRRLLTPGSWYQQATATLKELESQLVERQNVYCSYIQPRDQRLKMEKKMLLKVAEDPIGTELDLESDLKDIFKRDTHCADLANTDKKKNGSLMWVYLKYWQLQVTVQKYKRAEEAIFGGKIQSQTK